MRQALVFLVLGLAAGFAAATWFNRGPPAELQRAGLGLATATRPDDLSARLRDVEAALAEEAARRAALETTLETLAAALSDFTAAAPEANRRNEAAGEGSAAESRDASDRERVSAQRAARIARDSAAFRQAQLVDAGFAPDRAQWITAQESQMRMDLLYAQYEATREGESFSPVEDRLASQARLRATLGDGDYERYLEATGQQTSVGVREVLESSPAQAAGLRTGDEIVAYGGERVFNLVELNRATLGGQPGEMVAVDIVRDGQPMQLYMPRGPIGISGGGRGFGFVPGRRP